MAAEPTTFTTASPQSVDRIFAVLDHLAVQPHGDSLAGIARASAAPKTSMVGLLAGMVRAGYLARDAAGAYTLGSRMFGLAVRVAARADLHVFARPILAGLVEATGETALLGAMAPDAELAMYLDKLKAPIPCVTRSRPASGASSTHRPWESSSSPTCRRRGATSTCGPRSSSRSPRTPSPASASCAPSSMHPRAQGMARTNAERVAGASALAAPVFGADGAFLVGLGIAGPSDRMRTQRVAMERVLKDAARRLTALAAGLKPTT